MVARAQFALQLAKPRDAQAIATMSRDLIESGLGWEYRDERVTKMIFDPETVALVARDASQIAGFAIMTFGDDRAHLVLLAVRQSHQRQGIARAMLDWLLESTRIAGVASVHVELRAINAAAFALYRNAGFEETLRVPGYYRGRESAVRMLRSLRAPGAVLPMWQPPTFDRR